MRPLLSTRKSIHTSKLMNLPYGASILPYHPSTLKSTGASHAIYLPKHQYAQVYPIPSIYCLPFANVSNPHQIRPHPVNLPPSFLLFCGAKKENGSQKLFFLVSGSKSVRNRIYVCQYVAIKSVRREICMPIYCHQICM